MEKALIICLLLITLLIPRFRNIFFPKYHKKIDANNIISERIVFFDWLKGLCIIIVIIIHATTLLFLYEKNCPSTLNYLNNLLRFVIPIFLIITGILLKPIQDKKDIWPFYFKKLALIWLPYFIFTAALSYITQESFSTFLYNVLTGNINISYYYIIIILQLYLIYPLIIRWRKKTFFLHLALGISIISWYFLPEINSINLPFFGKYLFFFAYGIYMRDYFLANHNIPNKNLLYWLLIATIYIISAFFIKERFGNMQYFYGLAIFNVLLIYKERLLKYKELKKMFINFGRISLWIYLSHFYIESMLYYYLSKAALPLYWRFTIIISLTLLASFIIGKICSVFYKKTSSFYS